MFSINVRRRSAGVSVLAATALAFALASCGDELPETPDPVDPVTQGPGGDDQPTETEMPTDDATDAPTDTPTDTIGGGGSTDPGDLPIGSVSDEIAGSEEVQAAVADLAGMQGVEADAVIIAGHRSVTWRDGSIGCAEPGGMYTQALVPGDQLILEIDGEYFSYHRGSDGPYEYCANPDPDGGVGDDS